MNAIAQPRLCGLCGGAQSSEGLLATDDYICHAHAATKPQIVESDAEQSWSDFCRTLSRPAFLLAESGFGDLEQP